MSSRLYELKARIKADASVALEVRDLYTVNGKEFEGDPRPIADGDTDAVAFLAGFNASAVAERDAKIAELAQANSDHAAAVATLNTEHAAALQAKADEIADLTEFLAAATAAKQTAEAAQATAETALTAAQARIEELEAELDALKNPPANQRIFEPRAFANQLLGQQVMLAAWQSDVPEVGYATLQLLLAKYVDLDDPDTAALLGVLAAADIITEDRVAEILATGRE